MGHRLRPHERSRPGLLVAQVLAVALLYGLNDIVGYVAAGGAYTPFSGSAKISAAVWDETVNYAPGASRFLRLGQVYSGDVKGVSGVDPVQPLASNVLIGSLGWVLGSLEWAWMLLHGLLPALAWLLLYALARLYVRPAAALAVAWTAALAAFGTQQLFLVGPDPFQQPLELQRIPEPALSFPLFVLAVYLLARGLGALDRRFLVAGGAVSGGLAYVYYFYWFSAVAGVLLLLLLAALLRSWPLVRSLALAAAAAAVASLPYVLLALAHRNGQVARRNVGLSHAVSAKHVVMLLVLAAAAAAVFAWRPRSDALASGNAPTWATRTIVAFLAGAAVGMNAQLVTGYDVSTGHFLQRVIKPGLIVLALLLAASAGERFAPRSRVLAAAAAVGVLGLVVLGSVRQVEAARRTLPAHRTTTPRMRLLLWMRANVPTGDVVGTTDRELIAEIPAVTGNFLFVPDGGKASIPTRDIVVRYVTVARLQGWTLRQAESATRFRPADGQHAFVNISYLLRAGSGLPAEVRRLWPSVDLRRELRQNELDYLVAESPSVPPAVRALYPAARVVHVSRPWTLVELRP